MSTVSSWVNCSWAVRPQGNTEGHSDGSHSPPQPPTSWEHPQTTSQSGLWPTDFAWAAPITTVETRFAILYLYLHSITLAARHISGVVACLRLTPGYRGCLRWSKLTLLAGGWEWDGEGGGVPWSYQNYVAFQALWWCCRKMFLFLKIYKIIPQMYSSYASVDILAFFHAILEYNTIIFIRWTEIPCTFIYHSPGCWPLLSQQSVTWDALLTSKCIAKPKSFWICHVNT